MIYLKNIREKQTVYIPRTEINSKVVVIKSYDEGYADGIVEGKNLQKLKLTNLTVSENGVYKREDGWNEVDIDVDVKPSLQSKTINVTKDVEIVMADDAFDGLSKVDVNATQYGRDKHNEGYNQGKNDGINEQKAKLEGITITENGTYTKEDGYNSISVNVEDLNGGYDKGYNAGYDDALTNVGKTAQVLNITENGIYTTKYSEPDEANVQVTGYFDDGTPFYDYAHLTNHIIATGIKPTKTSRVELWWRPDFNGSGTNQYIFTNTSPLLQGFYLKVMGGKFGVQFGQYLKTNQLEVEDKWYHIVVSADGLVINGETITTLGTPSMFMAGTNMFINGYGGGSYANGYFGMVKIDGKTFIPTEDGFINYTTNIPLNVQTAGEYDFVENPTYEGNLIRTVHVNVPQNTLKTQNKILTVTKDLEVVYPDSGYNALAEVSVDATQYGQEKQNEGYTEGHLQGKTEGYENGKADGIEEGYANGYADGKAEGGEINLVELEETPKHGDGENNVIEYKPSNYNADGFSNVKINVTSVYHSGYVEGNTEGYNQGYNAGYEEGKSDVEDVELIDISDAPKMEQVNPSNNLVYTPSKYSADGFSKVSINVTNIYGEGYNEGYDVGYSKGVEEGTSEGGKINVGEVGIKFGYSTFAELPPYYDFKDVVNMNTMFFGCDYLTTIPQLNTSKVTSMKNTFSSCSRLTSIPMLDTSNVTSMYYTFSLCESLTTIPQLDTSNVTVMTGLFKDCTSLTSIPYLDTSKVVDMVDMFYGCKKLTTIPQLNTSNVGDMDYLFNGCTNLVSVPPLNAGKVIRDTYIFGFTELPNLTDFGGLIGLKASVDNDYGFIKAPNLTYQSCINILNGLYDFVGNGKTPSSSQGKLKVHQNFLDLVGNKISIATNKGWTITA